MTNQEEYKVIRGSVNGQEKYCRIPIRRKVDNAMAIRMIQKEVEQLEKACEEDCLEIELSETDFEQRIEIFELAITALEKQEPKKPIEDDMHRYCCSSCGNIIAQFDHGHYLDEYFPHCEYCGQAVDWAELLEERGVVE